MHRKTFRILAAVACLAMGWTGIAHAESFSRSGQSEEDWRYTFAFYAFLPAKTSGTSTIVGTSVDVDLDLGDILDLLDFAAAGRFEAWRGDWGIIFDANYVALEAGGVFPGPLGSTFSADIRQKWLAVMAAYKVADFIGANGKRQAFDLQFGARYNSLRQEITLSTPLPLPVLGGDKGWWEPVIGARGMWEINDRWAAIASLDLGGFGAGGNDLQIGVNVGVDWKPWDRTSIFFGYRYLSMDYADTTATGPFEYDVDQHGPVVGVKFRF